MTAGENRIILDFDLTPGTDYQLGVDAAGHGLFRNSAGVTYPYVLDGWVTITKGSNAWFPLWFYFFFYDWEIQGPDCTSPRTETIAYIGPDGVENVLGGEISFYPNPAFGSLTIVAEQAGPFTVEITNMLGQLLLKEDHTGGEKPLSLDISRIPSGIYTISVHKEDAYLRQKLVVE